MNKPFSKLHYAPHTPGPWHANGSSVQAGRQTIATVTRLPLRFDSMNMPVWSEAGKYGPHWANARLLAAAPMLLEACEIALANLTPAYSSDHLVIKSLRTAIAKAKVFKP